MNLLWLMVAPFAMLGAVVGWLIYRSADKIADTYIAMEQSAPLPRFMDRLRRPPGPRARAFEAGSTRFVGGAFLVAGTVATVLAFLFGFGILPSPPAN
jgi:hypothetical protein